MLLFGFVIGETPTPLQLQQERGQLFAVPTVGAQQALDVPAGAGAGIPSLQPCHLAYGVNRRKKPEEERSILTFCLFSSSAPALLDPCSGPPSPGLGLSPHLRQFCQKEGYVSPKLSVHSQQPAWPRQNFPYSHPMNTFHLRLSCQGVLLV